MKNKQKSKFKRNKKANVSNDLIWILVLIAGAVLVGLMSLLIVVKKIGLI